MPDYESIDLVLTFKEDEKIVLIMFFCAPENLWTFERYIIDAY